MLMLMWMFGWWGRKGLVDFDMSFAGKEVQARRTDMRWTLVAIVLETHGTQVLNAENANPECVYRVSRK